jgi:hypothetical protein
MAYYSILLDHLERTRSIAGFLLEQRRRKEKEQFIVLERGYTKAFTLDQTYLSRSLTEKGHIRYN